MTHVSRPTTVSAFRRDSIFLVIAALMVSWYVLASGGGFALDDSWIHQVYGRNLAQNGEWAFIPGQPSAASTSPLYTVLLSIGYRLNIPFAFWTHLLGVLALVAAASFAARLADRMLPNRRYAGWLSGLAILLTWHLIWAAASGMETMLFGALTLATMFFAWREMDEHNFLLPTLINRRAALRGLLFGVVAALTTLARPEGILVAGLAGLGLLFLRPKTLLVWIIGAAGGYGLTIAPYLLLNLQLTGGLLPNTAAAKFAQHAPLLTLSYPERILDMLIPIIAGGQALLLPGLVVYILMVVLVEKPSQRREIVLRLLPVLWPVALIALYAARLPASYQHGRYVIPALPAIVTIGTVGTVVMVERGRKTLLSRTFSRALALSIVLLIVFFAFITGTDVYRRDVRIINEEMVASAYWIRDNIPPEELLAIHDIGAVGYFAPRPIVDVAGLISPDIIPLLGDTEAMWAYLQLYDARYLMAFPDQIPGDDPDDSRLCELFVTDGPTALATVGYNMTIYRLSWGGSCTDDS